MKRVLSSSNQDDVMMCEEQRPTRISKRLRFSEYSSLVLIEPKSFQEIQDSWWNKNDYDQFKANALHAAQDLQDTKAVKLMKHIAHSAATGSTEKEVRVHRREEICGIEHLISGDVLKTLYIQRKDTISKVLAVQDAQKYGSLSNDPAIIANVSEINSSFSRAWCSRITHFQHGARCA